MQATPADLLGERRVIDGDMYKLEDASHISSFYGEETHPVLYLGLSLLQQLDRAVRTMRAHFSRTKDMRENISVKETTFRDGNIQRRFANGTTID